MKRTVTLFALIALAASAGSARGEPRLTDGKPTDENEDLLTGFVLDDEHVFGRPVGLAVAPDGALFVCEDANGIIWRVSYGGGPGPDAKNQRKP